MKDNDPRIADTTTLLALIREGNALGLNRQLDYDGVAEDIDPKGTHVLGMVLPYHQAHDKTFPDHHRVSMHIKVKDSMEPLTAYVDITDAAWDSLTHAKDLASA
jgi:hypothetical protein